MTTTTQNPPRIASLTLVLPGPDRKRVPSPYHYRVTYRDPAPAGPGCVMTWEVRGGREPYQMALERTPAGELVWHCTCADAVYRGDLDRRHLCKHAHGLIECIPATHVRRAG